MGTTLFGKMFLVSRKSEHNKVHGRLLIVRVCRPDKVWRQRENFRLRTELLEAPVLPPSISRPNRRPFLAPSPAAFGSFVQPLVLSGASQHCTHPYCTPFLPEYTQILQKKLHICTSSP